MNQPERYASGIMAGLLTVFACGAAIAQEHCVQTHADAQFSESHDVQPARSGAQQADVAALHACLVAPEDVLAGQDRFVLVDVRAPGEVARLRIPDVLNLHLSDIDTSPFISRDRPLVLVGDGTDTVRLLRACVEARDAESSGIRVLAGGVRAWHRAGGRVIGDIAKLELPWTVASSVIGEFTYLPGTWLVSDAMPSLPDIASARRIDAAGHAPQVLAQRLRAQARTHPPLAILIMLQGNDGLLPWRNAFLSAGLPEPMFHAQGIDAYAQWARQQAQGNQQAGRTLGLGCRWN